MTSWKILYFLEKMGGSLEPASHVSELRGVLPMFSRNHEFWVYQETEDEVIDPWRLELFWHFTSIIEITGVSTVVSLFFSLSCNFQCATVQKFVSKQNSKMLASSWSSNLVWYWLLAVYQAVVSSCFIVMKGSKFQSEQLGHLGFRYNFVDICCII